MMLSFVWAEDLAGNIGYEGKLPWHLPADLHHFKKLTINHPVVMGRKTFDSLPHLLPNRLHLVLTHDESLVKKYQNNPQVKIFIDYQDLKNWMREHKQEEIAIIGGSSLFQLLKDDVDILHRTKIHHLFKGDVKMSAINYQDFQEVKIEKHHADEKNKYDYTFIDYLRK